MCLSSSLLNLVSSDLFIPEPDAFLGMGTIKTKTQRSKTINSIVLPPSFLIQILSYIETKKAPVQEPLFVFYWLFVWLLLPTDTNSVIYCLSLCAILTCCTKSISSHFSARGTMLWLQIGQMFVSIAVFIC